MSTRSPRPSKRAKISHTEQISSLSGSISPPIRRNRLSPESPAPTAAITAQKPEHLLSDGSLKTARSLSSPIQLTYIRDLPPAQNAETVRLTDILGDPMIKECWQFNYLFDVEWLLTQFDQDVRQIVQVKIVHGSWRREDSNKIRIDEACKKHSNVKAITAYMPEPFGTHHSKMMILFRHDDLAQVIIHTANMIPRDWTNMCQAVWSSPLLPLADTSTPSSAPEASLPPLGAGERFKNDLLSYLSAYGASKTKDLVKELKRYEFSSIHAALIAGVPSKQMLHNLDHEKEMTWGWPRLQHVLSSVPTAPTKPNASPQIVVQISSIATLGQTSTYLDKTFFPALSSTSTSSVSCEKPNFSIIFPTAASIRRSLDGYASGASIHTKIQTPAQQKQLAYLKPLFHHWEIPPRERPSQPPANATNSMLRAAGRRNAAPHIKTYIRFTDSSMNQIDWAMLTSANLSTQAWGAAPNAEGTVKISSFEIGVVVWPHLYALDDQEADVEMVPVFGTDTPPMPSSPTPSDITGKKKVTVGFRMPYDLPLVPYGRDDEPWCATKGYTEPDWMGQVWTAWTRE